MSEAISWSAGVDFNINTATRQLGAALGRLPSCYHRVTFIHDTLRFEIAGLVWEGADLPPPSFFAWIEQCRYITTRLTTDGRIGIRSTKKFRELLEAGMWLPPWEVVDNAT